jgi:SAM-dependent methyltransferase
LSPDSGRVDRHCTFHYPTPAPNITQIEHFSCLRPKVGPRHCKARGSQRVGARRVASHAGAVPYDRTRYLGAAAHYRYGRPPVLAVTRAGPVRGVGTEGDGRLLDVGCGPGVLAVRLASFFEAVVAVDPDVDMLVEGRRAAAEKGVGNISWVQALAEDLPEAAPGQYRLVTFGSVLPWDRRSAIGRERLRHVGEWWGRSRSLSIRRKEGRAREVRPGPPPIPHDEIRMLVEKYLGSTRRAGKTAPVRTHRFEDVLVRTRFGEPHAIFVPGIPDLLRDSESVLSGYLSMSFSAPHRFGGHLEDFTGEVRALLASRYPRASFGTGPAHRGGSAYKPS